MKKTVTINLNGILFHIDEDAYEKLNNYLISIESHFSGKNEASEVMGDIEARIAELLNEKIGGANKVVSLSHIEEIIKIMGNPVDFEDSNERNNSENQERNKYEFYHQRRMYRDPDNRFLGGVCGGLGAYLNIDPVILRIVFVLVFFGFGVGLLIYIILWIVIPEAKTTAQKLEMKGNPVNVSNIGNFIREEFNQVKNNFSNQGKKK